MLALALAVSGCAKRPDAIVPADIPMAAYTNFGCDHLAQEYLKEQTNLAAVSNQQSDAATGDAVGVFSSAFLCPPRSEGTRKARSWLRKARSRPSSPR